MATLGVILILIPLAFLTIQFTGVLQRIDWYQYRPTAWVMKDLDDAASSVKDRAWTELQRRLSEGSLSAAQQIGLVERALNEQRTGGGANGYMVAMTDFLGTRYLDHKLSTAHAEAFFANAMKLQLDVRPFVGRGDPVPFRIASVGRGPLNGWWMRASQQGCWVDEKRIQRGTMSRSGGFSGGNTTSTLEPQPPGKHRLRVEVEVGAGVGNFASLSAPLDHPRTLELTADFQVVSDQVQVQWTTSPNAAVIGKCLTASDFTISSGSSQPLAGSIEVVNPPVNLAFEVFARVNGKEYSLGRVSFHQSSGPNANAAYHVGAQSLPPGDLRKIDIILRSSESTAKDTIDFTTAWEGEIVIPRVPVRQPPTSQPVPSTQK